MSTVNTARIFFLWNQLKRPKFNPKTLKKLDSIETIIQLNAMSLGLKLSIYEIDPEIIESFPKSGPTVLSSTIFIGVGKAPDLNNNDKSVTS